MKQQQVLAALALVAFGWLAAPAVQAAGNDTAHPTARHVKKHRPHAKPARRVPKVARKAAPAATVAAAPRPSTDTQSPITKPGDYAFAIQHDGRTRTYRVHVPPGYTPSDPAPLVVALRAADADSRDADGFYGLTRESNQQGFVAVFPDAYRGTGTPVGWNAGTCCGGQPDRVNDVGFIETVVNNVFRQMSIARLRIYAAGMADGGMMAYRLACELPHVFTAVASVAGTDNTASCTPDKPVSILHLHAKNDQRMPYQGGADPLAKAKLPALTSAPQTVAKWAKLDGCMEAPQPVLQKAGASCEAYTYCRGQAEVRLCSTDTGGHSWPGATKHRGEDTPSQALAATQTIWSFFSAH